MLTFNDAMTRYRDNIQQSYKLYLFSLYYLMHIANYAREDFTKKSSKLLPTDEDRKFTAKLADNPLMSCLNEHRELNRLFRSNQFNPKLDEDNIRLIYTEFAKLDLYKEYVNQENCEEEDHRNVLLELYKFCLNEESFIELLEDHFPFWYDDKSLIVGAMKRSIKALPTDGPFFEEHEPTDETTLEFGEALFKMVNDKDTELLDLIEPTLKNWDVERVAVIDMVLLKMALCELMYFPTIPTKVTLNEFVEISKQYSTEKSKDFINGILDRLMKKLHKDGKIVKEGRGLVE